MDDGEGDNNNKAATHKQQSNNRKAMDGKGSGAKTALGRNIRGNDCEMK